MLVIYCTSLPALGMDFPKFVAKLSKLNGLFVFTMNKYFYFGIFPGFHNRLKRTIGTGVMPERCSVDHQYSM